MVSFFKKKSSKLSSESDSEISHSPHGIKVDSKPFSDKFSQSRDGLTMLSPVDQMFIWGDSATQPMHVGGLLLFSYPEDADDDYVTQQAEYLQLFQTPVYPFNRRLKTRLGQNFWEADPLFDLDHHFRHRALPKPGRIRELLAYVSAAHGNRMDNQRPLWECHLIEGFEDRQFALYLKVHHAMVDGVSAMRMMMKSFSTDKALMGQPPMWAREGLMKNTDAGLSVRSATKAAQSLVDMGKQFAAMPKVAKLAFDSLGLLQKSDDSVSYNQAPMTMLNQAVTSSRRFAAQSYSLSRFKAIAQRHDATLNDVLLSVCGSALRKYLLQYDGLPEEALIAAIPVSLHDKNETEAVGNDISLILSSLGTNVEDPLERLSAVKRSTSASKNRLKSLNKVEINAFTALTGVPMATQLLTGLAPKYQGFNVIVSNVPGPKQSLYFNGAELQGIYPVSIPGNRMALNITVLSYRDSLEFGLTACRRTLPSMQKLLQFLEEGLVELERALNLTEDHFAENTQTESDEAVRVAASSSSSKSTKTKNSSLGTSS